MTISAYSMYMFDEDTGNSFPVAAMTPGDYQPGTEWLSNASAVDHKVLFGKQGRFDLSLKKQQGYLTVACREKPPGFYKDRHIKNLSFKFFDLMLPANGNLPPQQPEPWHVYALDVRVKASDARDTDALRRGAMNAGGRKFAAAHRKEHKLWRGMDDFQEIVLVSRDWAFAS